MCWVQSLDGPAAKPDSAYCLEVQFCSEDTWFTLIQLGKKFLLSVFALLARINSTKHVPCVFSSFTQLFLQPSLSAVPLLKELLKYLFPTTYLLSVFSSLPVILSDSEHFAVSLYNGAPTPKQPPVQTYDLPFVHNHIKDVRRPKLSPYAAVKCLAEQHPDTSVAFQVSVEVDGHQLVLFKS